MAVALLALKAEVEIEGAGGSRTVAIGDFYRRPGNAPDRETVLAPGEMITAVKLPPPVAAAQFYRKVRDRSSYAFALVSVAAVIGMNDGVIAQTALAFGGLAPCPWRDEGVDSALVGARPTAAAFEHAADILLADAEGHGGNDFKIPLARRTLIAVLHRATQGASR
jgi:xanthine dehydrogenase YagS FAD-binding subunit